MFKIFNYHLFNNNFPFQIFYYISLRLLSANGILTYNIWPLFQSGLSDMYSESVRQNRKELFFGFFFFRF